MSAGSRPGTFDRIRSRAADDVERHEAAVSAGSPDADGKRALFSQSSAAPAFGAVTVECSSCGQESAMTATQWLRAAIPSLHLPLLGRRYPSWMRCPACATRTWVKPRFRV